MDHRDRLAHARHHLKALDRSIRVFTESEPYVAGLAYDSKERCYLVRIREVRPIPKRWALVVGDILHNFRAALDSLTYALAKKSGSPLSDSALRRLQFPIGEEPGAFFGTPATTGRKAKPGQIDRIAPLSAASQAAIERLQPYHGRVKGFRPALLVLNDLANIDKHRHIVLIAASATSSRVDLSGPGIPEGTSVRGYVGPFADSTVIGKWAFRGSSSVRSVHPKVNVEPHLGFDVSFAQAPAARSGSVLGFLGNLHDVIRETIFPPLETLL